MHYAYETEKCISNFTMSYDKLRENLKFGLMVYKCYLRSYHF